MSRRPSFGHGVLRHVVLLHRVLGHLVLGHRVFLHRIFDMPSLDMVSFFISSAKAAGASGAKASPMAIAANTRVALLHDRSSREIYVALSRLSHAPNTSSSVSRCRKLAFASRFCENGQALLNPVRSLICERALARQNHPRQLLRGFSARSDDPPRHAAHRHARRCGALQWAIWRAFCGPIRRCLRTKDRLPMLAARRLAGFPYRLRKDRY